MVGENRFPFIAASSSLRSAVFYLAATIALTLYAVNPPCLACFPANTASAHVHAQNLSIPPEFRHIFSRFAKVAQINLKSADKT